MTHANTPITDQDATLALALSMGLSQAEFDRILEHLGRTPNHTELGIFAAMWSEHCSYKSSKKWLKTLTHTEPHVIQGPGENAGVIDIGQGWAAVFKIESHNHPSYIEPYQGAATGVGGILRDVFTMGARPIALLNALRFGAADHKQTPYLASGAVAGIGGYGNCIGIPTVGGEINFDPSYNGNILVNAMAVGLVPTDKIFYSAASGIGNHVVYIGAKTGRDGIHGATMASAEFSQDDASKRPTVQVGDPFAGKLLMEACLELMDAGLVVAIQDMGAAGLTSAATEMAAKGGLGMQIDLDRIPQREADMTPYEIMLSESQERMLVILKPDDAPKAQTIIETWDLDYAIIGTVIAKPHLIIKKDAETVADLPLNPLTQDAPEYDRPYQETPPPPIATPEQIAVDAPLKEVVLDMLAAPHLCSRRWVWEQYDRHVMADTIASSGGDAAIIRVHGTQKALALTTDCTPRYVKADPFIGAAQAVAEAYRNITASGARPLALTNNLNFGNPQKPLVMGQIVGAIKGIAAASQTLETPVVSGNVSLYNETDGKAINPTPVIGMVGVIDDIDLSIALTVPGGLAPTVPRGIAPTMPRGIALTAPGRKLIVVGQHQEKKDGWLGCSIYAEYIAKMNQTQNAAPPPVDLNAEKKHGTFIRDLIAKGLIDACHDISDGGLMIALAEMILAHASQIGADMNPELSLNHSWCFGEDQARYIISTALDSADTIIDKARNLNIPIQIIGTTNDSGELKLTQNMSISIEEMTAAYENTMPQIMTQNYDPAKHRPSKHGKTQS